jgi:hypothetical protein
MVRLIVSMVFLNAMAALAYAQTPEATYDQLQARLEAAQAAAVRPGDESLDCEGLATELVATAKDTAVRSYVARSGAAAQEKLDAMNALAGSAAAVSAISLFGSVVPGGGWVGHAAAVGQAEAQKAQAARNIQQRMQEAQEMMGIMPQLMRGQRVIELAQVRDCAWLRDAMSPEPN